MRESSLVRRADRGDLPQCMAIVRALVEYFAGPAVDEIQHDLTTRQSWVCEERGAVVGFAVAHRRWPRSSEIRWLAIDPRHRGVGLGTSLLNSVLDELATDGVRLVEVKTLDRSCDYEPYVATRAFWERRGFVQVDVIDPYPGWEPGNPCAIYVASLETARRSR